MLFQWDPPAFGKRPDAPVNAWSKKEILAVSIIELGV